MTSQRTYGNLFHLSFLNITSFHCEQVREAISAQNVLDLISALNSLLETPDQEFWSENIILLVDLLGNLCVDNMAKKNAMDSNKGLDAVIELIKRYKDNSIFVEHG